MSTTDTTSNDTLGKTPTDATPTTDTTTGDAPTTDAPTGDAPTGDTPTTDQTKKPDDTTKPEDAPKPAETQEAKAPPAGKVTRDTIRKRKGKGKRKSKPPTEKELQAMALADRMTEHVDNVANAAWRGGELDAYQQLLERFTTWEQMYKIFGSPNKAGTERKDTARSPSLMQYLESGFIMNKPATTSVEGPDEMPEIKGGKGAGKSRGSKKHVFNAAFTSCMMRFGFYPLASVDAVDSMHFDFAEILNTVKGRAGSFSPKGFGKPK